MGNPRIGIGRNGSSVLQVLRISLHVMFALLLLIGTVMALRDGGPASTILLPAAALGLCYLAGTVAENRFAHGRFGGYEGANLVDARPHLAQLWLGVITLLWALLFVQHLSFTWLMFPIVFLAIHLLPLVIALAVTVALTAISIAVPATTTAHLSPGAIIGPILGAMLAIIVSLAYRALHEDARTYQRTAEKLRATQAELALREHESGRIEERERLAREIHDTLAQGLSSIVLISRATEANLAAHHTEQAAQQLGVIHQVATENLAEARRFIRDLSSPSLTSSLAPALRRLCEETQELERARGRELTCTFQLDGPEAPFGADSTTHEPSDEIAQALVRIAQGALANVRAHAQAHSAVLTLGLWEEQTTLDIFDDGRGFDPAKLEAAGETGGYGFTSLRERATALGGTLTIDSAPGEGTVINVSIPATPAPAPKEHHEH